MQTYKHVRERESIGNDDPKNQHRGEANTRSSPPIQGGTLPATDPQAAHGSRVLRAAASRAEVVERKQGGGPIDATAKEEGSG